MEDSPFTKKEIFLNRLGNMFEGLAVFVLLILLSPLILMGVIYSYGAYLLGKL